MSDPLRDALRDAAQHYVDYPGEIEGLVESAVQRRDWRRRRAAAATKWCPRCEEDKPVSDFGAHAGRPDGLQAVCRSCR